MNRLTKARNQYLNKNVVDKNGIRAVVTDVMQYGNPQPGQQQRLQVELNNRMTIAFFDFENLRRFKVVE